MSASSSASGSNVEVFHSLRPLRQFREIQRSPAQQQQQFLTNLPSQHPVKNLLATLVEKRKENVGLVDKFQQKFAILKQAVQDMRLRCQATAQGVNDQVLQLFNVQEGDDLARFDQIFRGLQTIQPNSPAYNLSARIIYLLQLQEHLLISELSQVLNFNDPLLAAAPELMHNIDVLIGDLQEPVMSLAETERVTRRVQEATLVPEEEEDQPMIINPPAADWTLKIKEDQRKIVNDAPDLVAKYENLYPAAFSRDEITALQQRENTYSMDGLLFVKWADLRLGTWDTKKGAAYGLIHGIVSRNTALDIAPVFRPETTFMVINVENGIFTFAVDPAQLVEHCTLVTQADSDNNNMGTRLNVPSKGRYIGVRTMLESALTLFYELFFQRSWDALTADEARAFLTVLTTRRLQDIRSQALDGKGDVAKTARHFATFYGVGSTEVTKEAYNAFAEVQNVILTALQQDFAREDRLCKEQAAAQT
jgi:hypothetical protein